MRIAKRFLACAILTICLSLIMQGTTAYFTAETTARSVITTGSIRITLWEEAASGESQTDENKVLPGDTVRRIATVTNHEMPAYVRIKFEISVQDAQGQALDPGDMLQLETDTEDWTYLDGWWYYNQQLATDETTAPLLMQIQFLEEMNNVYKNCEATVKVVSQATQAANNGTDVFSAAGWPES